MSIKSTLNSPTAEAGFAAKLIARFGDRVSQNKVLAPYFRTGVGGVGECVIEVETVVELIDACQIAQAFHRPYIVVGGGTGSLMSQVGSPGLTVVNRTRQILFTDPTSLVRVESGVSNQALITTTAGRGLGGIEFLSAIPGTVGGAIATNASFQGQSILPYIRTLTVWLPGQEGTVTQIRPSDIVAATGQPISLFKQTPPPVLLSVDLQLSRLYPDEIMRRLRAYRKRIALIADRTVKVGRPFWQELPHDRTLRRELERFRAPGIRPRWSESLLEVSRGSVQPNDYRAFLQSVANWAKGHDLRLDQRLSYLGYWPDDEGKIDA